MFSNDFEVVYIDSSCSLLVVDRGNQAIREIQLHFDDCAYQYGTVLPPGRTCHYLSLHLLCFFSEDNNLTCRFLRLTFTRLLNDKSEFPLQELQCFLLLVSLATCSHYCSDEWE